ncbi:MAG: nucleotide-binding universal stress UspA family protein [Nonlabens sp.]|jgi:nucleotide-binding universal stress UspA family protein
MKETYRILISTDFSETADNALKISIMLASRSNSQVQILHVADIPPDWVDLVEDSEHSLYTTAKEQLALIKKQLTNRLAMAQNIGVQAEEFLQYNKGYKAVLDHSGNHHSDLVVMGAHGHTGLKGILMGSYAQKVLHHTNIPVLVTTLGDLSNDLRKVVYVSDFPTEDSESLLSVIAFAHQMRLEIEVLFVNTPSNFKETDDIHNRIDQYIEKAPKGIVRKIEIVDAYRFESGLAKYCEKNDIDIISMPIYKKHHSWDVMGTTIEDVMNHLDIPVLGIPLKG